MTPRQLTRVSIAAFLAAVFALAVMWQMRVHDDLWERYEACVAQDGDDCERYRTAWLEGSR